ncbi:MAG TPA: O-methyltransferase [Phototrophicaceae bacterium]|jgi:predicted O-methyltransferase YrrM|nr:O-methyltransferase [Phototrophicaceae bacterium]
MEQALRDLLAELEALGRDNDAREQDRRKKMLNLEPETAHFISLLIRSGKRKHILEVGTSNGYSTIWLAWSVGENGQIISIERESDKQVQADQNLRRAGLRDRVDLRLGDATEVIEGLQDTFDVVFFDADRISAHRQLEILLPRLQPGTLVLADNALSHPEESASYLATIEHMPEFDHMVVPVGKGLSIAYRN